MTFDSSAGWAVGAPLVFVALGLLASLLLFWSVKRELHRQTRKQRLAWERISARLDEAEARPERECEAVVIVPAVRTGFNLHRRVQAMRLLRRGADVAHIAAALNVPRKEVELLIRVQQLPAAAGGAPD